MAIPAGRPAGVTLNFYVPLRNEPVLFSTLKNEPKQLNNDPFHWNMNRLVFQPLSVFGVLIQRWIVNLKLKKTYVESWPASNFNTKK